MKTFCVLLVVTTMHSCGFDDYKIWDARTKFDTKERCELAREKLLAVKSSRVEYICMDGVIETH